MEYLLRFLPGCFSRPKIPPPPLKALSKNSDDELLLNLQQQQVDHEQHVIVMRHGDRINHAQPGWVLEAKRAWDPPLLQKGKDRAFSTGKFLKNNLPVPIHRVFVPPFIRCIQTASQVSIEYGLCEMLNREAIRPNLAPKKAKFNFNISELEAQFPAGIVDRKVEPIYQKLPRWEESVMEARARYELVIRALSDKYPSENLLIVTHSEGVRVAISGFLEDTIVHEVENCAYSHLLKRQICLRSSQVFTVGKFELVTKNGQSGVHFGSLFDLALDV